MRSGHLRRACISLLAIFAVTAPTAAAADPTVHQLPDATHAYSLTPTADGTVWFIPSRGSEWGGRNYSIVGRLAPDGSVTEHAVAGFETVDRLALGPAGEAWVAGYASGDGPGKRPIVVGRLSPSATLAEAYTVGLKGWIKSLAISADAIWLVHGRAEAPETIERVSIAGGSLQQFAVRPECDAKDVALGAGEWLWFAEACRRPRKGESGPERSSINRITPDGEVVRRPIPNPRDRPVSLTIGADGTVWFGVSYQGSATAFGRITRAGSFALYTVLDGWPGSIAVGPEGRLWFQSSFGGWNYRALNSIGVGGRRGQPICADPTCSLEPTGLVAGADGSLWYDLTRPNLNTGGGGSGLYIGNEIANEAGLLGNLMP